METIETILRTLDCSSDAWLIMRAALRHARELKLMDRAGLEMTFQESAFFGMDQNLIYNP